MICVLGHLCLDIIPAIPEAPEPLQQRMLPGSLLDVGAATLSGGGAVANTGFALHRLGEPVRLIAKVGADPFAGVIRELFATLDPALGENLLVAPGNQTSYTVVLNPPGGDRTFLHCPGSNDTFTADEMLAQNYGGADLVHFGYPPLMRQMYIDAGRQTVKLFEGLKRRGLTTSLDMALPDPDSPAGKAPWRDILLATLPHVDIFTPSLDEIIYMLDPARGVEARKKSAAGVPLCGLSKDDIRNIARDLLAMGCGTVLMKFGKDGAYAAKRSAGIPACGNVEEHALPCFKENVFGGATGAGDSAIAGFLCARVRGMGLRECLELAVATGAASVEKPDATSGIPRLDALLGRIRAGWPLMPSHFKIK